MLQPSDVRLFLRDRPEHNRLLDREEFTQPMIDQAMRLTVMKFNEITPVTQYGMKDFPHQYTLLIGTCYHLLLGGGIGRDRNRLGYQTNGVSIDDERHADVELKVAASLKQEFESKAKMIKIQGNAADGWGMVFSEYLGPSYYRTIKESGT